MTSFLYKPIGYGDIMRISIDEANASSLQELTGKTLTKNGNEVIREVTEIVEKQQKPDSPCWVENNCSEEEQSEEESQ